MDYDFTWLEDLGIDVNMGLEYTRGADKYICALQRYYKAYNSNRDKVVNYYKNKDWKNYCIIVHSLKSNSKMIGATSLATAFETLELASKNEDIDAIESNHASALDEWNVIIAELKPIGEMEVEPPADEISAEEARDIAGDLLSALEDFDDELSLELVKKLAGYPFRLTQRGKLEEATEMVENFLYDDAAEIITEIIPAIE